MGKLLAGLHDREGARHVPAGGWCLDTVHVWHQSPVDYTAIGAHLNWLTRLNNGYGSEGTIPSRDKVRAFAEQCAAYVAGSRGCHRWIIGNEPNHPQEWPGGQMIDPVDYARCYAECRSAIQRVQPDAQVLVAAVAPWSVAAGDWIAYWRRVLNNLDGGADGFTLHSYIHANDPHRVNSDAKMAPPYTDRFFEFNAYRDLLNAIPQGARHLPVYMTEACPVDVAGWEARGIIPAMLANVAGWNDQVDTQKVRCVVFYRYPTYDRWAMADKPDVLAEFKAAAPLFDGPVLNIPKPDNTSSQPLSPPVVPTPAASGERSPVWDPRLDERGARLTPYRAEPGETVYRLVSGEWLSESESGGRHHIFVDVHDEAGRRMSGVNVVRYWPDGEEIKATDTGKASGHGLDFPMFNRAPAYGVRVEGASDRIEGLGLGSLNAPRHNIHTSYRLVFQSARQPQPDETQEMNTVSIPHVSASRPTASVPDLIHPVENPAYRRITQAFGARPHYYRQFVIGGVPLRGHEGLDFGTPTGAWVRAVDGGIATEVLDQGARGYGRYIKVVHAWGESVYAHLDTFAIVQGQRVAAGERIGRSGNTGNSDGPHLHFGLRVHPYDRADGWGGYTDPGPYLAASGDSAAPQPVSSVVEVLRAAAQEFGLEESLVLSLAWAESSFNPLAVSSAGAQGLMQVMPPTWREWAANVGASQPFNPRDNARVGSAYLAFLLRHYSGSLRQALIAYNFGPGNVDAGRQPPQETVIYREKIIHGRDLLQAVTA